MNHILKVSLALALAGIVSACADMGESPSSASATPAAPRAAAAPSETDMVVAEVQKKQSDFRAFCQTGAANITKVVGETVGAMAQAGQIKGDPRAVGGAAGTRIGTECRG